jgi:RNA polymerase sigma-70 factor (ECF subfamily)
MKSEKEEFLKILTDYQSIIHKVNLIYFRTAEDRKDNFQEVSYQLWRAYPSLQEKDKIASWIYAIAINTSVSKIRKDSRYVLKDVGIDKFDVAIEDGVEHSIDFQYLLEELQRLGEIDRSIMLLYLEDYSYKEISEIIGISSINVGVKIGRAKKQLEKILKM